MLKSTFVDGKEAEGGVLNKKTRALPAGEETPEGGGARVTGGGTEKKKTVGGKKEKWTYLYANFCQPAPSYHLLRLESPVPPGNEPGRGGEICHRRQTSK